MVCEDAEVLRPRREGALRKIDRFQQKKRSHPQINPVGAVKENQAEGEHRQQSKQQGLDHPGGIGADQFHPAELVIGRHGGGNSQQRRVMQAARVRVEIQVIRRHPYAKGQKLRAERRAGRLGTRQLEHHRDVIVGHRDRAGEVAEIADLGSVREKLVDVVDIGWASESQGFGGRSLHARLQAIPGVSPIPGVAARSPTRHIPCLSGNKVDRALFGRQIDVFPLGVVEARLGPERLMRDWIEGRVADAERPWTVERDHGLAQPGRCGAFRGAAVLGGRPRNRMCLGDCPPAIPEPEGQARSETQPCAHVRFLVLGIAALVDYTVEIPAQENSFWERIDPIATGKMDAIGNCCLQWAKPLVHSEFFIEVRIAPRQRVRIREPPRTPAFLESSLVDTFKAENINNLICFPVVYGRDESSLG